MFRRHPEGRVSGVDGVRGERPAGRPTGDLLRWVEERVPGRLVHRMETGAVMGTRTDVMIRVRGHPGCFDHAGARFPAGADGWLAVCARVHGAVVVTGGQGAPESGREVRLPGVCGQSGAEGGNTFPMPRVAAVRFDSAGDGWVNRLRAVGVEQLAGKPREVAAAGPGNPSWPWREGGLRRMVRNRSGGSA